MLRERSFSSAHIPRQDNTLGHLFWATQNKVEKFHKEAMLRITMR
jgi:hypothetical protein